MNVTSFFSFAKIPQPVLLALAFASTAVLSCILCLNNGNASPDLFAWITLNVIDIALRSLIVIGVQTAVLYLLIFVVGNAVREMVAWVLGIVLICFGILFAVASIQIGVAGKERFALSLFWGIATLAWGLLIANMMNPPRKLKD